jgi:Kef-type K+ transport system membrane component KefB
MDIFLWLTIIIVWGISCAFASILGYLTGSIFAAILGTWAYWPGFTIGFLALLHRLRPMLFFYNNKIKINPSKPKSTLLAFVLGLWLGKEYLGKDE